MAERLSSMYKVLGSVPALRRPGVVVYNCNPCLRTAATTKKVFHRTERIEVLLCMGSVSKR